MNRLTLSGMIVAAILLLSACAPAAVTPAPASIPATAPTAASMPTEVMAPTATSQPTAAPAPTATAAPTQAPSTIVDVAVANGNFKTLVAAVQAAGLVDVLKSDGPFTVFAPTDDAFAKLPAGTVETLLKPENKAKLASILLYHVVPGKVMASDVTMLKQATTLDGPAITFTVAGDKVSVNDANVIAADVEASNGVIHVIDSVILPPDLMAPTQDIVDTAAANGSFTTLVAAVKAAGLVDTLKGKGPFTVFAPTDDAFKALPTGTLDTLLKPESKQKLTDILTYHVVAGSLSPVDLFTKQQSTTVLGENIKFSVKDGAFYINDAQVVLAAVPTTNGTIYVIDQVLLPQAAAAAAPTLDIVDTAAGDGRFKTLVAAVQAAGLVDTLKGAGPFTVFAPTDDAFAKLPAGTVETLLKPENKQQLMDLLTYHVVAGKVMAADVVKLTSAATINGKNVTVKVSDGKVYINDAQVIITDILTSNGVIHVINSVLTPPM